ncbi:hypothetical protein [Streptomyces sp. NPDC101234]|uniref:hypothetical protein n=1 Tax=Streptomyces sp. NPDC101234 TaxID=3366138 RepID=UPI0037FBF91D
MTAGPGRALRAPVALLTGILLAGCAEAQGVDAARTGDTASATRSGAAVAAGDTGRAVPPAHASPSPSATRTHTRVVRAPAPTATTRSPAPAATRVKGPDLSRTPSPSPSPTASAKATARAVGLTAAVGRAVIRIGDWSSYVARGGQDAVDACRNAVQWTGPDIGREDGYKLRTVVIVGHDYCGGYDRFAQLPQGTRVTLTTTRGTYTYEVYADYVTPGRGVPAAGLYWGDLTLQSCVGPDTGFSYLVRL